MRFPGQAYAPCSVYSVPNGCPALLPSPPPAGPPPLPTMAAEFCHAIPAPAPPQPQENDGCPRVRQRWMDKLSTYYNTRLQMPYGGRIGATSRPWSMETKQSSTEKEMLKVINERLRRSQSCDHGEPEAWDCVHVS